MKLLVALALLFSFKAYGKKTLLLTEKNSYTLKGRVDGNSVNEVLREMTKLHFKLPKGKALYLVLDTPGGSIVAGNYLIDHLRSLGRPVHTVSVFAASMGFAIAQALGTRYAIENNIMMAHPAATTCSGNKYQMAPCLYMLEKLDEVLAKSAADRIGMKYEEYQAMIMNEKWWYGNDSLKENAVDEIIRIRCSKKLMEKVIVREQSNGLFVYKTKDSGCPTLLSPL